MPLPNCCAYLWPRVEDTLLDSPTKNTLLSGARKKGQCWMRQEVELGQKYLSACSVLVTYWFFDGFPGAHFVTYIDITLFFCMYQIYLKNKSKL